MYPYIISNGNVVHLMVHIRFDAEFDMFVFEICYGINGWSSVLCEYIIQSPL